MYQTMFYFDINYCVIGISLSTLHNTEKISFTFLNVNQIKIY